MFTHLRYLAFISFFLMLIAAGFVVFYSNGLKNSGITKLFTQQTVATLSSYSATVWDRYAAEITANPTSPYLPSFASETKRFFEKHPVSKITIFSPDVVRLYYQSNGEIATTDGSTRITLFNLEQARSGTPVIRTHKSVFLAGSSNPNSERTMLQAIIPIMRVGSPAPEAFV